MPVKMVKEQKVSVKRVKIDRSFPEDVADYKDLRSQASFTASQQKAVQARIRAVVEKVPGRLIQTEEFKVWISVVEGREYFDLAKAIAVLGEATLKPFMVKSEDTERLNIT